MPFFVLFFLFSPPFSFPSWRVVREETLTLFDKQPLAIYLLLCRFFFFFFYHILFFDDTSIHFLFFELTSYRYKQCLYDTTDSKQENAVYDNGYYICQLLCIISHFHSHLHWPINTPFQMSYTATLPPCVMSYRPSTIFRSSFCNPNFNLNLQKNCKNFIFPQNCVSESFNLKGRKKNTHFFFLWQTYSLYTVLVYTNRYFFFCKKAIPIYVISIYWYTLW